MRRPELRRLKPEELERLHEYARHLDDAHRIDQLLPGWRDRTKDEPEPQPALELERFWCCLRPGCGFADPAPTPPSRCPACGARSWLAPTMTMGAGRSRPATTSRPAEVPEGAAWTRGADGSVRVLGQLEPSQRRTRNPLRPGRGRRSQNPHGAVPASRERSSNPPEGFTTIPLADGSSSHQAKNPAGSGSAR